MSSMAECQAYLYKLQKYLPFLGRTLDRLASLKDKAEWEKVKGLIQIISSDVHTIRQLRPDTLERCEGVCRTLHSRYGREDEANYRPSSNPGPSGRSGLADAGSSIRNNRFETAHRPQPASHNVDYDETPRSPSPEENKRLSTSYVPKEIPDRRSDLDLRTLHHSDTTRRDNLRSPTDDAPPKHLRTEPVEIPTAPMLPRVSGSEGFSKHDQDYRIPFDNRQPSHHKNFFEERRVVYQNDTGIRSTRVPGVSDLNVTTEMSSLHKRESRFDRYSALPSSVAPLFPQDDHTHPVNSNFSKRPNQWDIQSARERNEYTGERDRQFPSVASSESRHFPNRNHQGHLQTNSSSTPNLASYSKSASHWTPPVEQTGHTQRSRLQDNAWQPKHPTHPSSAVRNEVPVPFSYPRMDQAPSRFEQSHLAQQNASQSWSGHGSQPHLKSHFVPEKESSSGMGYRHSDHPVLSRRFPSPPLVPPMASSASASISFSQPTRQATTVSNYPPASQPPAALPPTTRREDPRLANRSIKPPQPPASTNRPLSTSSNPVITQSSRPNEQRDIQKPPLKPSAIPESTKDSLKESRKDTGSETSSKQSSSNETKLEERTGSNSSRSPKSFVSPLDSLYKSSSQNNQTGRGYGIQKSYRIPKRHSSELNSSKQNSKVTVNEEANDASVDGGIGDTTALVADSTSATVSEAKESNLADDISNKHSKDDDHLTRIPFDMVEGCLKRAMSPNQAAKLMEKIKTGINGNDNLLSAQTKDGRKPKSALRDSGSESDPTYDRTVSSSGEALIIHTSEDEASASAAMKDTPSNASDERAAVDSSNDQDLTAGPEQKKTRGRRPRANNSLSSELARLHEDLTDYMKGTVEAGGRRSRSRTSQQQVFDKMSEVNDHDGDDEEMDATYTCGATAKQPLATAKGKRGRKRKVPPPPPREVDLTQDCETREQQQPEKMEIDVDAHDSSSTTEPNSTLESLSQQVGMRGRKMTKKKQKPFSQKAEAVQGKGDPSPEVDPTGKSKKRKKAFIPTRLSLRGRRSMYENSELNDALEEFSEVASATADEYFQCKECTYLGQKIIHHYVNEHNGTEIPFVSVPESEWTTLSSLGPAEDLSHHHPVKSDLLADLSWIPTRPNLMTPTHCKLCSYSSCKRSELIEHICLHAMPTNCKYRCNLCFHTESNFFDILDHVTGHTGEYRYHCNYCDFRVASRTGIKQHMSSLHESQDVLFYSTSLPDVNQLWIYGFVCVTCRFVQIDQNLLERHLTANSVCNKYLKVNLISAIHEDSSETACSINKREEANLLTEKMDVFLCHDLEEEKSASQENMNEYISKALRGQGSSAFIQNLAEKLTQRDVTKELPSSDTLIEEEPRPDESLPSQSKISHESRIRIDAIGPRNSRLLSVSEPTNEELNIPNREAVQENCGLVFTKPNSWLETTISKLTDKLGNSISDLDFLSTDLPEEDSSYLDEEDSSDSSDTSGSYDEESEDSILTETEEKIVNDCANLDANEEPAKQEEICTEGNPSPFLRIENVMSLITADESDCLDPIQSDVLVSNVTIRKGEITFPFSIAHDRPAFAAQLKEKQPYQSMMHRDRLRNFYKCMAYRCMFSSQSAKDFLHHLNWHNRQYLNPNLANSIPERQITDKSEGVDEGEETLTVSDFCLCSYCPASFETPEKLVEHVHSIHSESKFQCSSCFFRARLSKTVAIHAIVAHNNDAYMLDCQRGIPDVPLQVIEPRQVGIMEIPRYICNMPDCLFTCIHRSSFVAHMSMSHPGIRNCECRHCKRIITCSSNDYTELFLHMNKHGLGFFHCAFCQWGTDLPTDILLHMCLVHPSLPGKTIIRSPQNIDGVKCSKPLKKFWTSGLPNSYSRTHVIDLDGRFNELFDKVQVLESTLGLGDDIFDGSPAIESPSKVLPPISIGDVDKVATDENDHQLNGTEQAEAQVFHGFGEEEKAKAKEKSSVCIVLDQEIEDSNSTDVPSEQMEQIEDGQALMLTGQDDEEEKQVGLSGRELYMCGNIGCDETAESVAAFKEHLLVCDLARDSRLLTCRHCGKNMKQISYLIEHLRVHGVKRFSCSLCSFRAVQLPVVRKHMKTVHRVNVADEVAIGPGPGPALPENTLYSLYPREMAAKLKSSRTRAGSNRSNRTFSCKEAGTIPMKSILPYTVKCAHCGYTSKVRANMVRHLALHEMRIESANGTSSEGEEIIPRLVVPDQAPVNPVPHLESPAKGKMFDKMANLAYSSHSNTGKMGAHKGGKMSGRTGDTKDASTAVEGSSTSPASSHSLPPIFVPDHKRYVCGFDDCGHLTFNDNVLKHHMQTLHKKAVFSCPHCRVETANELSLDGFRNHLKIHGPKLYKCGHCDFYHWQLHEIESHLTEKHPNRTPWQIVIREPGDTEIKRLQNSGRSPEKNTGNRHKLPWHCCLCKHASASIVDVSAHVNSVHGVKSQFKCALCPVRCNIRSEFDRHFAAKHPKQEVQVLSLFYRVESHDDDKHLESELEESTPTKIQPLWKKNELRPRHIRGILLEENEIKKFNPTPSTSEMASTSAKVGSKSAANVPGASAEQQREPDSDPVYGTYGSPMNGLLSCPMCADYHVAYGRDLKNHLYRELNYNRFFCSICDEGACSRLQAQKHVEKQHPSGNAYFREITSNQQLENWVEKVIVTQTTILKTMKSTLTNKAKRPLLSPVTSPVNSPTKLGAPGPKKGKKAVDTITASDSLSADYPKNVGSAEVVNFNVEPQKTESSSLTLSTTIYSCLACKFDGYSEIILENHVVTAHGTEATSLCLQCGFKFTTQQSIVDHQQETKHTKVNNLLQPVANAKSTEEFQQPSALAIQKNDPSAKKVKKSYWCKHCVFRAQSEHGINLHWQSKHSAMNLPLDFGYDLPTGEPTSKPDGAKILYKCLYCGFQGQFEEVKEHSRSLHPNNSPKISRMTSKIRHQVNNVDAFSNGSSTSQPTAKKIRQDLEPTTSNPVTSPSGMKPTKTMKATGAAGSAQTVFVVAPPTPPTHTCVCCFAKFYNETALIRHHATHPSNVPLRYTCLDVSKTNADSTSTTPQKPELAVMEIRFSCPVCSNKHFTSLTNAQSHVVEHKQAWKCCHCTMLFSSPEQALSHWKEVHPGLQGRLESIDSNQIVEKLSKEIKLIRIQLNMKNLLKSTQSADQSSKGASPEKSCSDPTPTNQPSGRNLTGTSARKSTSGNSFLKDNSKKESLASSVRVESQHEPPPGSSS